MSPVQIPASGTSVLRWDVWSGPLSFSCKKLYNRPGFLRRIPMYDRINERGRSYGRTSDPRIIKQNAGPGSNQQFEHSDLEKLTEFYLIATSGENGGVDTELKRMDFEYDGHGRWVRPNRNLIGLEVVEHNPNGYGRKYVPPIKGDGPGSGINVFYKASVYRKIYPETRSKTPRAREIGRFKDQISELFLVVDNEYNR